MDDVVELNLSKAVNVTNTTFIRASVAELIAADSLDGPAVELVQFHVLIHCTSGSGRHMVDFEDHEMERGTAIWVRPGQVQQWTNVHDGFDADVAVFQSSMIPDLPLFDHLHSTTGVTHLGDDVDRMQQQMEWMAADLAANQDHATAAAVVGVLLRLFARHANDGSGLDQTPGQRLATDFVASVDENIQERTVTWHAQQIGASTRSVARATASAFAQRPKEVIDARIILEAQRRLAWSSDDVATIARDLRFSEASNFTKFFRRRTGVSPTVFRETATRFEPAPSGATQI